MFIYRMRKVSIKYLLLIFWCCLHNGASIETIKSGIKTKSLKYQQGLPNAAGYEPYYRGATVEAPPSNVEKAYLTAENQHITENIITDYYLECPSQYTGPLPYAYDCRRFLNCWHGKGHVQTCAVGTVFNPETLECDRPHKVKCGAALSTDHKRSAKIIDATTDRVQVMCAAGQEGLQQHPTDCTKFINCANGNVHVQQCGPGTAFNPTMQVCVHREKMNCEGREGEANYIIADAEFRKNIAYEQAHVQQQQQQQQQQQPQYDESHGKDILCPQDITGLFAYPFDYTKFINCKSGSTAIQNCMPGFAFNIFKGFCEPLDDMPQSYHVRYIVSEVSHEFSQTLVTCPPGTDGLHLYPFDAEKYIQCSQGQMIIMHCPETKVFSIGKHSCLPQGLVTKEDRVRLAWELQQSAAYRINGGQSSSYNLQNMVYCPIGSNGIYPHPFDCSKYLKCVNGRLVSESCNSGSAYSLSRRVCDTKDVVNSQDRIPSIPVMQNLDYNYDHTYLHSLNDGLTYLVCPPGVEGYFVHPFDCTKYLECKRGETTVRTCPNGSVYSISQQQCVARDQVEAYDRVEYKTTVKNEFTEHDHQQHGFDYGITCNLGSFEIYAHPKDAHKFIRCANGRLTIENCPYNQEFNVERGFCHEPSTSYNKIASSGGTYNQNREDKSIHTSHGSGRSYNTHHETTSVQKAYDSGRSYNRNYETTSTHSTYNPAMYIPAPSSSTTENSSRRKSNYAPHQPPVQSTMTTKTTTTETFNYHPSSVNISPQPASESNVYHNVKPGVHYQTGSTFADSHSISSNVDIQNVYNKEINCPRGGENSHLPHPYDCAKFIICSNGVAHVQNCAPGTAWNPAMETCDYASNMNCPSSTSSEKEYFTCPPGISGPYQHPYDWHKFLSCSNGKGTIMDCAPGTVFSISMRVCKSESLVPNTDRCNEGAAISAHNYNQETVYSNREGKNFEYNVNSIQSFGHVPLAPMPKIEGDIETRQHATRDRWSDMNRPRPSISDQRGSWSQTNIANVPKQYPTISNNTLAWSGHAVHVDHRAPAHTLIQEEGSFEPNRNHNVHSINVPLAPFSKPSAKPTQNFNERPLVIDESRGYPSNSNAHTTHRHYNNTISENRWTPIESPTSSIYPSPSYKTYTEEDVGQHTLLEADQFPSESRQVTVTIDESNLYGGLQPPAPTNPTYRFIESQHQIPKPSQSTTTTTSTLIPIYHKLSNATIQTFPRQPHYSSAYSTVTHSRNVTRLNNGVISRKIPQHSLIKPPHRDRYDQQPETIPQLSTTNYDDERYSDPKDVEGVTDIEADDLPISDALKLLLRPYTSGTDVNSTDDMMGNVEKHIMNLAKQNNKVVMATATTSTTTKPFVVTKTKNAHHEKDAELIFAGEQPYLVNGISNLDSENRIQVDDDLKSDKSSTPNRLQISKPYNHSHKLHKHHHNYLHHHHHHNGKIEHSRAFHKAHPHLPNPFASEEPELENSDSDKPINPQVEITTPKSKVNIDLRSDVDVCSFDCGNNKCIADHEVCNGIDNCGNRLDELYCDHLGYEIRLTGGESPHMGRIEIKILDNWGYVCDDKFGLRDADVLCRELGFKLGAMEVRGNSYYPPADLNPNFMMDEVDCRGNETSLKDCAFKGWGVHNCGPDEVVGVICKVPKLKCPDNYWLCSTSKECIPTAFVCDVTPDCTDGSDENPQICNASVEYRLEGGRRKTEGRLEVFYRGEWGTVCDDDFTLKEAQVVCNSLGYYGKAEIVKNIYGPGNGPIWLDQVSCIGNETGLDKCNHWTWGENNCNHTEDVCLKCSLGTKPSPVSSINMEYDHTNDQQYSSELDDSDFDVRDMYQNLWQRSSKAVKVQKRCGQFKTDLLDEYEHPEERVINGTVAKKGRHPWQATIRVRGRGGISNHWCGAVLISKRLLLTAAHCLYGYAKGSYYVRLGDHYANIAENSELDSFIENWYIHEKFRDQKPMNNDIALVLLKNKVRFNDYIQPVCLPDKESAHLETNRLCTISGWGSIKSGESTPSNVLRSAQVPILSDEICQRKNVYGGKMTDNMFCAGSLDESADACDGDSGGPLVCSDDDGETLYGIISWGQHCGYANRPGVYVRVQNYVDWIHEKINLMIQQGKL